MKKIYVILAVVLIALTSLGIFVSCDEDKIPEPSAQEPTSECRVDDFQQLKAIFPHDLLLPEECNNEYITVRFLESNKYEYWRDLIRKNKKIDLLTGGYWSRRYTDYTINVQFDRTKELKIPDEIKQHVKDEEFDINGYRVYQEKSNIFIYVIDEQNSMSYILGVSEIVELTPEEKDSLVKNYFNLMCRI